MKSSLPASRKKSCAICGVSFTCGSGTSDQSCWCNEFPPIMPLDSNIDCRCPECLKVVIKEKIDDFIKTKDIKSALKSIKKINLNSSSLQEGIDYYIENGFWVFTEWYHLRRGACCSNGCRHCPYR